MLDEVRQRCARTPLLLVLEDLHWADPATRRAAARLARAAAELPLLVLTTRPEQPPDFARCSARRDAARW